jgi:hypothetical protein
MVAISGKVTAATVAASLTSVAFSGLAPHIAVSGDVKSLAGGLATALVTFGAGYFAKHGVSFEQAAEDAANLLADFGVELPGLTDGEEQTPGA